jgi:hypothetical protein
MANINETNYWTESIYEIATTDDVVGGTDGISNTQATQLASRTNFLKEQVDDLKTGKQSAGKANQLTSARRISITGDASGNVDFDGTTDVLLNLIQQDSGIQAGCYRQVTVDIKGRVIDGTNPTTLAEYGITDGATLTYVQQALFPTGTRLPFAQPAAPTGWTQINHDSTDNRMLRVVNGNGGNVGGTHSPVINNVVPAHTHTFTTGLVSSNHTHAINDPGHGHSILDTGHAHEIPVRARNGGGAGVSDSGDRVTYTSATSRATTNISIYSSRTGIWTGGVSSDHTHSGSTDNGSSQTNWQPRYIDLIICEKN